MERIQAAVAERKIHAAISVAIARRAARMSMAGWPKGPRGGGAEGGVGAVADTQLTLPTI